MLFRAIAVTAILLNYLITIAALFLSLTALHCSSLSLSLLLTVTVAAPTGDAWSEIREEFKSRAVFRMKEQLLEATAIQDVLDKLLFLKLMHFDHLTGAPTQVVSQLMLAGYTDDFDYFYQVISALFVLCLSIGMSASLSLCEAVCLSLCLSDYRSELYSRFSSDQECCKNP